MAQARKKFDQILETASNYFEFVEFNSLSAYTEILRYSKTLEAALAEKEEAVKKREYEHAAIMRDFEMKIVKRLLYEQRLNPSDHFFCRDKKVYYKVW